MSTYYDYYLENIVPDGWHRLMPLHKDDESGDSIYWHSRSFGSESANYYTYSKLPFEENCNEVIKEYQSTYDKVKNSANNIYEYYPIYYKLDLDEMFKDYNDNIHEFDGIISKNDYLKLIRNCEYSPNIINVNSLKKIPIMFQENYLYYAWDTYWSDYLLAYIIVPIVNEMISFYHLNVNDIRVVYKCE